MTFVSKNVYIDKLNDIVNKHNNTNHSTNKMKPVDTKLNRYFDFNERNSEKGPKFEIGNIVRISKHKNIFPKAYTPCWSEGVFEITIVISMEKKLL